MLKFLGGLKDSVFWGHDYDKEWSHYNIWFSLNSYYNYLENYNQVIEEKRLYWKNHGKYRGHSSARHAAFRSIIDLFNCLYNKNKSNKALIYEMSKRIYDELQMLELIGNPFKNLFYIKWDFEKYFSKYEEEKKTSRRNGEIIKSLSFETDILNLEKQNILNGNPNDKAILVWSIIPTETFTAHQITNGIDLKIEDSLFWLLVFVDLGILKMNSSFIEPRFWSIRVDTLKNYRLTNILSKNTTLFKKKINRDIVKSAISVYENYIENEEKSDKQLVILSKKILDPDIMSEIKQATIELKDMWKEFEERFGSRGPAQLGEQTEFRDPVVARSTKRRHRATNEQLKRLNFTEETMHGHYDYIVLEPAPWE